MAKADVKRCSSCREPHSGLDGDYERRANGYWFAHSCPNTGAQTRSRVSAPKSGSPAKKSETPKPAQKAEAKRKPAKKQENAMKAQNVSVSLKAVPLYDIDDADLWPIAEGFIEGIQEAQGPLPPRQQQVVEALEAYNRYKDGGTEHGGPGGKAGAKHKKLHEVGRQLAAVVVQTMLAEGRSWTSIRPPVLDNRNTLEAIADTGISVLGDLIDPVTPDAFDPSVTPLEQDARDGIGPNAGNAELIGQGLDLFGTILQTAGAGV